MTKVKICGITNLEDARVVIEAGADLLGFIFYEPSPRYVSPEAVKSIINEQLIIHNSQFTIHNSRPTFVGVFVNTPLPEVKRILDFCHLDAAQLHGEESPEFVAHFNGRAYKALRPISPEEANTLIQKYQLSIINEQLTIQNPKSKIQNPPCFLLDAYHPTLYGGTGHVADWTMAADIARRYPIMLAGSLSPENVAEAIEAVRPWGVDVSSGVEAEKGRKDHGKVRGFVEAVRNA